MLTAYQRVGRREREGRGGDRERRTSSLSDSQSYTGDEMTVLTAWSFERAAKTRDPTMNKHTHYKESDSLFSTLPLTTRKI